MKSGTHTRQDPCVEYGTAVKLKKLGFEEYTRQSFVGQDFSDWMGWQNDWKLKDPKHQMPEDAAPMLSSPTLSQVIKWFQRKGELLHVNFSMDDSEIEDIINKHLTTK